jgi:hypothetical protein
MGTRRVVTGLDGAGRAVVLADEVVEVSSLSWHPPELEAGVVKVWGANAPVTVPSTEVRCEWDPVFPPASGFRFEIYAVLPDSERESLEPPPAEEMVAEIDSTFPGLREHMGAGGMHATDSVDIGIVLNGEIVLVLEDGGETVLRAGDTFVQQGTRHAWSNRSDEVVSMAIVLIGATRSTQSPGRVSEHGNSR